MKRLFVFLACLMSLAIFSCSDSKDDNGDDPSGGNSSNVTLELSTTDIVFEAEGGEKEFYITCNGDWTITNTSQWCKTDITSGNGNATISVTVNPSELYDDQNANITVKAGTNAKILTVTQKKKDAILLTKDKYDLPTMGGDITVEVKSNITYTTTIPQEFNWIKQADSKSRALETKNLNFKIEANPNTDKREGFIIFKDNASELADTVHVYQAQKDELILTQDTYNVPAKGETINVELKTNVDYEVIIPEDAKEWIEQLVSRASRVDKLSFTILESTIYDERQAEIIIKDKNSDLADTLHIIQGEVKAIIVSQKEYEFDEYGGVITVEVKSNVPFNFSGKCSWIEAYVQNESTLKFTVHQNRNNINSRTAKFKLSTYLASVEDVTITITQSRAFVHRGSISIDDQNEVKDYNGYKKIEGSLVINGRISTEELGNSLEEITDNVWLDYVHPDGLKKLKTIGGGLWVKHHSNETLEGLQNLEVVKGNLDIQSYVYNYRGLENLVEIGGDFFVSKHLESFEGLNNLERIGGRFVMDGTGGGTYNKLTSFQGLNKLKSIGKDFIVSCYGDADISAFNSLESFEGLNNLENIGGKFQLEVSTLNEKEGHAMTQSFNALKSFQGLEKLHYIGGDFELSSRSTSTYAYYLSDYSRPTAKSLSFNALNSFRGLENLVTIKGNFKIQSTAKGEHQDVCISNSFIELKDYGALKGVLSSHMGQFEIIGVPFSPTKEQILNGQGKQ